LAIADLVGVRFDVGALRARRAAGIGVTDDFLALRVILACRRTARTTSELADALGFTASGIRRAVRVAYDVGAIHSHGARRHRTHPSWRPIARRLVAVELKRSDWRRAADQAWAYQEWANAAWIVLGQRPPASALQTLTGSGLGLGYLGDDSRMHAVLRPAARRHVSGAATIWAAEQALVHALAGGWDPGREIRPGCATPRAALGALAG
jgi:hypothetical protein